MSDLVLQCRVEACLPHCQRFGVNDAQAYLLERLGDIAAAIQLYVQDIQRCDAALIQAVLQGDLLLPCVTATPGRYTLHTIPCSAAVTTHQGLLCILSTSCCC